VHLLFLFAVLLLRSLLLRRNSTKYHWILFSSSFLVFLVLLLLCLENNQHLEQRSNLCGNCYDDHLFPVYLGKTQILRENSIQVDFLLQRRMSGLLVDSRWAGWRDGSTPLLAWISRRLPVNLDYDLQLNFCLHEVQPMWAYVPYL